MLKLGNLKLKTSLILAPMSGITSLPFRTLNRSFGCELCFLEMINACSLSYGSKKTYEMMQTEKADRPLGIQLLGSEPGFILKALERFKERDFSVLDFNAACPKKKVTSKGSGSSLLNDPKKLGKLLRLIVKNSNIAVTAKLRLGFIDSSRTTDIARYAEDAGVKAIFLHGRTASQGYSGRVDYEAVRKVKRILSVPLIASGDVFTGQLARKMIDETGCDGLTVARGALGNPWIFNEISEFLDKGRLIERPSVDEVADTMKMHLDSYINFYGNSYGAVNFRKFYIWYTCGFPNVRSFRPKVDKVNTREAMIRLIEAFRSRVKNEIS